MNRWQEFERAKREAIEFFVPKKGEEITVQIIDSVPFEVMQSDYKSALRNFPWRYSELRNRIGKIPCYATPIVNLENILLCPICKGMYLDILLLEYEESLMGTD